MRKTNELIYNWQVPKKSSSINRNMKVSKEIGAVFEVFRRIWGFLSWLSWKTLGFLPEDLKTQKLKQKLNLANVMARVTWDMNALRDRNCLISDTQIRIAMELTYSRSVVRGDWGTNPPLTGIFFQESPKIFPLQISISEGDYRPL